MKKIIISLFIVEILIACSKDTVELQNTVTAYNKMLVEALAKPDENIMEYFTSDDELARIGAYILRLKTEKKIMISEIVKLEFVSIAVSDDKKNATVNTREEWNYHFVDDKTRERVTENETIEYENIYKLVNEQKHWVVDGIEVKEK
ncbi:MAG: hypothetical protein AMK71_12270 [Nitrospira bacterium SG8_35_4]|nr:MAG: hypothetical protein AMK71_12270 [Nitrospira bacterium SG8_35_4]